MVGNGRLVEAWDLVYRGHPGVLVTRRKDTKGLRGIIPLMSCGMQ